MTIKRAGYTRWLSHDAAINSIRINYKAILASLENAVAEGESSNLSGPTVSGLLTHYQKFEFFRGIHFLCDVLAVLSKLNLHLQKNEANIGSVEGYIETALKDLKKLCKKTGGVYSQKIDE